MLANPVDPDADAGTDAGAPALVLEYDGARRRELVRREPRDSVRLEGAVPAGIEVDCSVGLTDDFGAPRRSGRGHRLTGG